MVIDGKKIAEQIFENLTKRVDLLKEQGITPHVAVILIGDDASSTSYVRQKEIKLAQIGGVMTTKRFATSLTEDELIAVINECNTDPIIHGIVVQRPLPPHIDTHRITSVTSAQKDVDGFLEDSPFEPPIALATMRVLKEIYKQITHEGSVEEWLRTKKITILGKGYTAGGPIIKFLRAHHIPVTVIDSKTQSREALLQEADIIISAVGKEHHLRSSEIKPGAIVIGVGMSKGDDNKLHADYDETDIATKASFYTPVPGGVGPLNVAMLLSNLVDACEKI